MQALLPLSRQRPISGGSGSRSLRSSSEKGGAKAAPKGSSSSSCSGKVSKGNGLGGGAGSGGSGDEPPDRGPDWTPMPADGEGESVEEETIEISDGEEGESGQKPTEKTSLKRKAGLSSPPLVDDSPEESSSVDEEPVLLLTRPAEVPVLTLTRSPGAIVAPAMPPKGKARAAKTHSGQASSPSSSGGAEAQCVVGGDVGSSSSSSSRGHRRWCWGRRGR